MAESLKTVFCNFFKKRSSDAIDKHHKRHSKKLFPPK